MGNTSSISALMYGVAQLLLGKVIMGLQATGVSTGISTGGIIAEPDANFNTIS